MEDLVTSLGSRERGRDRPLRAVRPDEQIDHVLTPPVNQYRNRPAIEVVETTTDERKPFSREIDDRRREIEP
jgi:hypothetical protein